MVNAGDSVVVEIEFSPKDIEQRSAELRVELTGFAPFLGGPLRFADSVGIPHIVDEMKRLADEELRFTPCNLLQTLAGTGQKFYKS